MNMAYVGRVVQIANIPNADKIVAATVVCGEGGKWSGVVKKDSLQVGDLCSVFLPDAVLPNIPEFSFMEKSGFRVKQQRLRGCPSEVLIMPQYPIHMTTGESLDSILGITKYEKPVDPKLAGIAEGGFPTCLIPKTDEPNFQTAFGMVEKLLGNPYYITEKADGSSGTALKLNGVLRCCSRNLELKDTPGVAVWELARKYRLSELLPENTAIQFEMVGNKIQGNPMGIDGIEMRVFNLYSLESKEYKGFQELLDFCELKGLPMVKLLEQGPAFAYDTPALLQRLAEGTYSNGRQREGIVIRPQTEGKCGQMRHSFKVINLNYKEA